MVLDALRGELQEELARRSSGWWAAGETTSGNIEVAAQHEQLLRLLAGLPAAAVRVAESHCAIGHFAHSPPRLTPGFDVPVMPSGDEQSGGTFPASLAA